MKDGSDVGTVAAAVGEDGFLLCHTSEGQVVFGFVFHGWERCGGGLLRYSNRLNRNGSRRLLLSFFAPAATELQCLGKDGQINAEAVVALIDSCAEPTRDKDLLAFLQEGKEVGVVTGKDADPGRCFLFALAFCACD